MESWENQILVHLYTDNIKVAINLNKISSIRMTENKTGINLLIDMDNGIIHIAEGIRTSLIYDDLIHAFGIGYIGKNHDTLHKGIEALRIYVTGLETE